MLKVYDHNESVCCQKVRLALYEKGVDFENIHIDIEKGDQHTAQFLTINPKALVPAIEHHGKVITESTIISEYINDAFTGPDLIPDDPYWRAVKRKWCRRLDDNIHMPHTTALSFVIALRFLILDDLDTPEKLEAHLEKISPPIRQEIRREALYLGYESPKFIEAVLAFDQLLADMNKALNDMPWLAGDQLSLADLDIAPYIHRLESLQLSYMWDDYPNVNDWYLRMTSRDSWHRAVTQEHIDKWVHLMAETGDQAREPVAEILKTFRSG